MAYHRLELNIALPVKRCTPNTRLERTKHKRQRVLKRNSQKKPYKTI